MKRQREIDTGAEELRHCLGCGAEIRGSTALGHCPRCLVELGLGQAHDSESGPPPKPAFKPRRFGGYELLEQIGRGGMGVVYKARQTKLHRTVALKMVLDSQLSSPVAVRRFEIEAEAAARLDHPHIVPIFEIGSEEDQPFISMRLIEGESLARRMARGEFRVPPDGQKAKVRQAQEGVVNLVAAVARAVHYAHQNGVLHRDIKPGNILIDAASQPHLTDFGLAKLTDSDDRLSLTGALMGTPSYMAPEQVSGAKATVGTDVYSLGALLYEMLAGQLPFTGATPVEIARKITEQAPPRPRTVNKAVDRELETICLKCLEKDPGGRYASAQALAEDLERWQRRETILARPAGRMRRVGRWTRRNPIGASLILSLFLGLLVSFSLVRTMLVQKETADKHRTTILQALQVSDFWKRPDSTVTIPSAMLAEVAETGRIAPTAGKTERYKIGMLLEEDPEDVVISYGRLLGELERKLSDSLGYAVLFDITLFKEWAQTAAIAALVNGEVNILKVGGLSYLNASEADPGITALVAQNPVKKVVIFARADSGIKTLADLRGKSIAAGDSNSTTRLWATFHLVQAGVAASSVAITPHSGKAIGKFRMIDAVLNKGYDAGAMTEKAYQEGATPELKVIDTFPSTPIYWLANSKLPPAVAARLKEAMVTLDKRLFIGLSDKVASYSEARTEDLEKLRRAAALIKEKSPISGRLSVSPDIAYFYGDGPGEGLSVPPDGKFILVSSPVAQDASGSVFSSFVSQVVHEENAREPFQLTDNLALGNGEVTDVAALSHEKFGLTVVRADTISSLNALLAVHGKQVLQTLPIPASPDGMKVSPDGKYAVVAVEKGGEIRIYDLEGGASRIRLSAVITKAALEAHYVNVQNPMNALEPEAVGISSDSSFALVTIQNSSSVAALSLDEVRTRQLSELTPEQIGDAALKTVLHLPYGFVGDDGALFGVAPDGLGISPDGSFAILAHEAKHRAKHLQGFSVIDLRGGLAKITAQRYSIFDIDPTLLANTGLSKCPVVTPGALYPSEADRLPWLDPASVEIVALGGQTVAALVIERYEPSSTQLAASTSNENRGSVLLLDVAQWSNGKVRKMDRVPIGVAGSQLEAIDSVQEGRWIFVSISNGGGDRGTFARLELLTQ